ncbi:hypothetical protein BYT27DRAFT_7198901 [Phlegmacium glaucopus]|nr:hypothetical protein BYT27DRAFT_7198901 [Phlegmacium glaucopus]
MGHTLENRLPQPEIKSAYTAWNPFMDEEELEDERETKDKDGFVWQKSLDFL